MANKCCRRLGASAKGAGSDNHFNPELSAPWWGDTGIQELRLSGQHHRGGPYTNKHGRFLRQIWDEGFVMFFLCSLWSSCRSPRVACVCVCVEVGSNVCIIESRMGVSWDGRAQVLVWWTTWTNPFVCTPRTHPRNWMKLACLVGKRAVWFRTHPCQYLGEL